MDVDAVFKRYDIRGVYPEEIDEQFANRLGKAVGKFIDSENSSSIIVSRDTREASEKIATPLKTGLSSELEQVISIGVGPTDRLARAASRHRSHGIQITASHNAWSMTGIKCVYPAGNGYTNEDMEKIKTIFNETAETNTGNSIYIDIESSFDENYLDDAEAFLSNHITETPHVFLDCCNGAAYRIGPWLFDKLGFNITAINAENKPDTSINPEPLPETRESIPDIVEAHDCECALLTDPDGDRLVVYDRIVGWLSGDQVFFALAKLIDANTIAASIDTSEYIEQTNADITYTRVGDIFVSARGQEIDADILGEPNGHFAFPAFSWYNSGLVAGALIAGNITQVRDIIQSMPQRVTKRATIDLTDTSSKETVMQNVMKQAAKDHSIISTIDGIKYDTGEATVLVRPSGTSEKVRIVVKAGNQDEVEWALDNVLTSIT